MRLLWMSDAVLGSCRVGVTMSEWEGGLIVLVFAAKAGAKQVFAIEASGLASKARENIKNNKLDHIITCLISSGPVTSRVDV